MTMVKQAQLVKRAQNWTLYATKRHEIYPLLWDKLYRAYSDAIMLIIDDFPNLQPLDPSAVVNLLRRFGIEDQIISDWQNDWYHKGAHTSNKEARQLLRNKKTAELTAHYIDAKNFFLLSQLYLQGDLHEKVRTTLDKLNDIGVQQQGRPISAPTESELTRDMDAIKSKMIEALTKE